ncbi:MAG: cytochrome c1 [Rhodospirillales bacterium]|jgi:cytochrome c1|nr:cytochrome c1 [Rhodospirillales bacterium]MBT4006882.1 cytochrome c1 [Rhodospirillales bacterium]MBT5075453.1 cytochrome c1 [Rhodospirillales bacterium]MBT5113091.1 cytochrome c1 [Rhodospirillales bacterium]MBT5672967.1 cytochrome c1 [Rhodospirillales bacterium]
MIKLKHITLSLILSAALIGGAFASGAPKPTAQKWSFDGIFGKFDRAALQRGFQVYKEVCSSCHSMDYLSYRNLSALGYSEKEIKAIAATTEVIDGPNDEGEMYTRKGRPYDRFKAPFPNANAARAANNGAFPPDLSVITKARLHGPDYLYALMTSYKETPPKGVKLAEGMFYNSAFGGGQIAMVPPLGEEAVEYTDGTKATTKQMAKDVTVFMSWAAEPEMEERKRLGIKVLLFLLVLTGLLYALKRKIWADLH